MAPDFSTATLETRRQWEGGFRIWLENVSNLEFYTSPNYHVSEYKILTFAYRQNFKLFKSHTPL